MKKRAIERSMFYNAYPDIFRKAEYLRTHMTEPEKLLWEHLRKTNLGYRIKAQHPIEKFIADFYCHKVRLVIEIDGTNHEQQREYDDNRTAEMEKYEITVIRFTNKEVMDNVEKVVDIIKLKIQELINKYNAAPNP
ncbi:MAG: endonuclease domain-containing protein [Salinivirgaceae bacterium]|nr:endonuclease domain-containing protein [Salinivirgaceae bacterium]